MLKRSKIAHGPIFHHFIQNEEPLIGHNIVAFAIADIDLFRNIQNTLNFFDSILLTANNLYQFKGALDNRVGKECSQIENSIGFALELRWFLNHFVRTSIFLINENSEFWGSSRKRNLIDLFSELSKYLPFEKSFFSFAVGILHNLSFVIEPHHGRELISVLMIADILGIASTDKLKFGVEIYSIADFCAQNIGLFLKIPALVDFIVTEQFVENYNFIAFKVDQNHRSPPFWVSEWIGGIKFEHSILPSFIQHGVVLDFQQVEPKTIFLHGQVESVNEDILLEIYIRYLWHFDIFSQFTLCFVYELSGVYCREFGAERMVIAKRTTIKFI